MKKSDSEPWKRAGPDEVKERKRKERGEFMVLVNAEKQGGNVMHSSRDAEAEADRVEGKMAQGSGPQKLGCAVSSLCFFFSPIFFNLIQFLILFQQISHSFQYSIIPTK